MTIAQLRLLTLEQLQELFREMSMTPFGPAESFTREIEDVNAQAIWYSRRGVAERSPIYLDMVPAVVSISSGTRWSVDDATFNRLRDAFYAIDGTDPTPERYSDTDQRLILSHHFDVPNPCDPLNAYKEGHVIVIRLTMALRERGLIL